MPVTLAQAKLNTQDDLDANVIDEFRKSSAILDTLMFHDAVNPMGGGSTLTYGYHRIITQRAAAFRAINNEYVAAQAEKARLTTDLKPLGGAFEIDRVLAQTARGAEVTFQMSQLIKSTTTKFQDEVVNGDTAVDANGFDGLDGALTGSDTESFGSADPATNEVIDWTDLDTTGFHAALDEIDLFLSLLDGEPTMLIGNGRLIAKFAAIARRANQYVSRPVDGLVGPLGRPIIRRFFGENILLVDAGEKAGSTAPIVPIESRNVDSDTGTTPVVTGLTDLYAVRIGMDGFHGVTTEGTEMVQTWLPDFTDAGAVKLGEVEMSPVSVALKATKSAAVLRNIKVQ